MPLPISDSMKLNPIAAFLGIALTASVAGAQKPVTTLPSSQNTCSLSDVKTLSMVNSIACAGKFNGVNDANSLGAFKDFLDGVFGSAYGPWTHVGQSDGSGSGPFKSNPGVPSGQLLFDNTQTGYFAIVMKASTTSTIYILDAGQEGTKGVYFNTAALGNKDLSHAGFWKGADPVVEEFPPETVVPEPSTYLLMAAGLAGVGLAARRRRRA